jgi:hypothetical protein
MLIFDQQRLISDLEEQLNATQRQDEPALAPNDTNLDWCHWGHALGCSVAFIESPLAALGCPLVACTFGTNDMVDPNGTDLEWPGSLRFLYLSCITLAALPSLDCQSRP